MDAHARAITFPTKFWPDEIYLFIATGYSLVWYITKTIIIM